MNAAARGRRLKGAIARAAGLAAVLAAGATLSACGLGPGEDKGDASLWVTRDYGREVIVDAPDLPVDESSTAMRLLDGEADLETTYGGEFVQSVDGIEGGRDGGRSFDWFFAVNGIVAERGSAQFPLAGGDVVWWDYRDWTDAMEIGAVVGSYPAPFSSGYDARDWGVALDCRGDSTACGMVERQLADAGVELREATRNMVIRVGEWNELKDTPEGRRLARGPDTSGVFARFEATPVSPDGPASSWGLVGQNERGEDVRDFGPEAGLVAAMRRGEEPPVWLVTGGSDRGVEMAAVALTRQDLERRYAAVVSDGRVSSLPVP